MVQQFLAEQQQVLLQMILEGHHHWVGTFPLPRRSCAAKRFSKEVILPTSPRPLTVLRRREFIPARLRWCFSQLPSSPPMTCIRSAIDRSAAHPSSPGPREPELVTQQIKVPFKC